MSIAHPLVLHLRALIAHPKNTLSLIARFGAKSFFYLLILLNIRSFPLVWHFLVFWPVNRFRIELLTLRIRTILWSKSDRLRVEDSFFASKSSIGATPYNRVIVYKSWAGPDDCDFYGHLSNSSYAKILDHARFKGALAYFPYFFRAGAWIALGATHFHYIREIPRFVRYEVHVSMVAWDQKWLFVLARFISRGKPKSKKAIPETLGDRNGKATLNTSFHRPKAVDSVTGSPPEDLNKLENINSNEDAVKLLLRQSVSADEDLTVHCISVSQICLKIGRITVPPAVALAMNGFSRPAPEGQEPYSTTNLPPHWKDIKGMSSRSKESIREARAFLKGGWREVKEGGKWWEEALGGPIEETRIENLKLVGKLREGLESAREIKTV